MRVLVRCAALAACLAVPAADSQAQSRASERGTVSQVIDGTTITIEYSRPVARGRVLFGPKGVVTWGHNWTPGANWATTLETDKDIQVNGQAVPKGRYSVWIVPNPGDWTVMLSRQHRAFHTQMPADSTAQARFPVQPTAGAHMETLAWYFPVVAPQAATLRLHWGTTVIPLHVAVTPTRAIMLSAEDRAKFVGSYRLPALKDGLSEPHTMEVFEAAGKLRARVLPALFEHDADFDLVPAGTGRFHPGWYLQGKFFDVETDMAFLFTLEAGQAQSLEFRGLAEDLLFARGERVR